MSSYIQKMNTAIGFDRGAARAATVVGDSALTRMFAGERGEVPRDVKDGVGTVVGAVAGALYGNSRKHGVIGAIAGASLGRNLPALMNESDRRIALCNLGETGFACACSLAVKGSSAKRAGAFVLGGILASAFTYVTKLRD